MSHHWLNRTVAANLWWHQITNLKSTNCAFRRCERCDKIGFDSKKWESRCQVGWLRTLAASCFDALTSPSEIATYHQSRKPALATMSGGMGLQILSGFGIEKLAFQASHLSSFQMRNGTSKGLMFVWKFGQHIAVHWVACLSWFWFLASQFWQRVLCWVMVWSVDKHGT